MRMTGSRHPLPDQNSAIIVPTGSTLPADWRRRIVVLLLPSTPKTMDKTTLPRGYAGRKPRILSFVKFLVLSSFVSLSFFGYWLSYFPEWNHGPQIPLHAAEIQARCRALNTKPGPPADFYNRTVSDRFADGTKHVWIRNATIWTGRLQGLETIKGDVFLMNGIIKVVGHVDLQSMGLDDRDKVEILDAHGAYVTPGYVFCHLLPFLSGLNSFAHIESLIFIHIWALERSLCLKVLGTLTRSTGQLFLGFALSTASIPMMRHTS